MLAVVLVVACAAFAVVDAKQNALAFKAEVSNALLHVPGKVVTYGESAINNARIPKLANKRAAFSTVILRLELTNRLLLHSVNHLLQ